MSTSISPAASSDRLAKATLGRTQILLAISLLTFVVAASLPYSWLITNFGYPDILRASGAEVLTKFHAGGPPLVAAWLAFGISALLFIPVALLLDQLATLRGVRSNGSALIGIASALVQALGLLRWGLVVPALAATYASPDSATTTRDAVLVVFDMVNRYGGMVLGEFMGQLLLAGWTALAAHAMVRAKLVPTWLALAGTLTLPLWVLGQGELLHGVLPFMPNWELIPAAFMAWEVWLLAIATNLLWRAWQGRNR
jgi:hypothetical protein